VTQLGNAQNPHKNLCLDCLVVDGSIFLEGAIEWLEKMAPVPQLLWWEPAPLRPTSKGRYDAGSAGLALEGAANRQKAG